MNARTNLMMPVRSSRSGKTNLAFVFWATIFVGCLAALVLLIKSPSRPGPSLPDPPSPIVVTPLFERAKFFDQEVQKALSEFDGMNREAVVLCQERLHESIESFRRGIPAFTDDITSIGTRFGILRRMPFDWWYEQDSVLKFTTEKFEEHLFNEDSLKNAIQNASDTFRSDLIANRNHLLSNVQAAVSAEDLPVLHEVSLEGYADDVTKRLQAFASASGQDSLTSLIITEIISGTAGSAAGSVFGMVAANVASAAAASAATAGGATVGGTAAGGGTGTLAGPVGTAIGAGVGLVVGILVDWWMTDRFQDKLAGQLNDLLTEIEGAVLEGNGEKTGMRCALDETCDAVRDACRESLFDRIVLEDTK